MLETKQTKSNAKSTYTGMGKKLYCCCRNIRIICTGDPLTT